MPDWTPDPVIPKFVPDPELAARAQRDQMAEEAEQWSPPQRYVRQQYEHAFAAVRVALDAARRIFPSELQSTPESARQHMEDLTDLLTSCHMLCDAMADSFYTGSVLKVQRGFAVTHEDLDELDVPR
jgi:hypothetical protein